MSVWQKINTKSSTEAELVGVSNTLSIVLWTRNILLEQGFNVSDNVIYQDNQSAILLEKHGCNSCGSINIRYFFVTDQIKSGEVPIEYCPTSSMLADFFTKPLQGAQFRQLCSAKMNLESDHKEQSLGGHKAPLMDKLQECVEKLNSASVCHITWSDVVRRGLACPSSGTHHPTTEIHGTQCKTSQNDSDLSPLSRKRWQIHCSLIITFKSSLISRKLMTTPFLSQLKLMLSHRHTASYWIVLFQHQWPIKRVGGCLGLSH